MTDSNHDLKAFVRRVFEDGWNRRSFEFLEGRTADSIPFHYNGADMTVAGDSLAGLVGAWLAAFPDLRMRIRHIIEEQDLVAAAVVFEGTHRGEWMGRAGTGRRVEVEEMMFFRFDSGTLVEMWEVFDEQTMWRQIEGEGQGHEE